MKQNALRLTKQTIFLTKIRLKLETVQQNKDFITE